MTSAMDYVDAGTSFGMSGATKWRRLRARPVRDRYSGELTGEDWSDPDVLEFAGALSSSSSMRTPNALREETTSTAYLTAADPMLDIMPGDRIRAMPDDGRCWEVTGYPSRDVNAFTVWQPTIEIPLTEHRG